MNYSPRKTLVVATSIAALLALGACGNRDEDRTAIEQPAPSVAVTPPVSNNDTSSTVRNEASQAADGVRDATANAGNAIQNAASNLGDRIDDATITASVNAELAKDSDLSALRINVDTKDGVVTLQGPAPTDMARERATSLARSVKGVMSVNNQLQVTQS